MLDTLSVEVRGEEVNKSAYDFVSTTDVARPLDLMSLLERDDSSALNTFQMMLASEHVLAKSWNTPEEDEAWAHL